MQSAFLLDVVFYGLNLHSREDQTLLIRTNTFGVLAFLRSVSARP